MKENIDLTKILKNCPKGTELYSPMYGKVYFNGISYSYRNSIIYCNKTELEENCTRPINSQNTDIIEFYYDGTTGTPDFNVTSECMLFPSKEQRDWSKFTAPWYKKEKFNPKTLQPFDKVLVYDIYDICEGWACAFFSHIRESEYPYSTSSGSFKVCIPYNDDTKHLLGTTEEAPEYYRYWK